MELKLENGRYVARSRGGFERIEGVQEIAQRVGMKLKARRGGFLPMPAFGSRLHMLHTVRPSERAMAAQNYVMEALSEEKDLKLMELQLEDIGNEKMRINMVFEHNGGFLPFTQGLEVEI